MRTFALVFTIALLTTSNAFALEDCNKISSVPKRLECLQKNILELSAQLQTINDTQIKSINDRLAHILKDDGSYVIQNGTNCLSADAGGAGHLRGCNVGGAPAQFNIHL